MAQSLCGIAWICLKKPQQFLQFVVHSGGVSLRDVYIFSDFGNFYRLKEYAIPAFVPYYTHNAEPWSLA